MTQRLLNRYEVVGLLGSGGVGQVYAARDQALGRTVAIKALRAEYSSDRSFLERFHAEAASLARLSHPNIATLYDLQADGPQLYMIMELVRGHTLEAVLTRKRPLGTKEALAVIAQSAAGLGYAHQMGVIHRDVKPSNLMLTESGLLKVMDFGIARVRGSQRLTRSGSIVGTLAYVAPEQIKGGEGDERSDLYSLACVLYEMLSGDPPFSAATEYELIRAQVDAVPERLLSRVPDITEELDQALSRALAKNPEERFNTVEEFARAVGADTIAGQSTSILRDHISGTMGPAPAPSEIAEVPPLVGLAAPSSNKLSSPTPGLLVGQIKRLLSSPDFHRIAPMLALGSVVALLLLGFVYIAGSSGWRRNGSQVASGDRTAVAVSENPAPSSTVREAPTVETPRSSLILPGPDSARRTAPVSPDRQPSLEPAIAPLDQRPSKAILPPLSDESPSYKGRVADWPGPNLIAVPMSGSFGLKFLKLYGILDAATNERQAK
jgi:serine/threonine protein kinase